VARAGPPVNQQSGPVYRTCWRVRLQDGRYDNYPRRHRTKRAALRALAEDARARMRAGDPSDAEVYHWCDGGWELVGAEVDVELVDPSEFGPV
jgi:hypothetical protein